MGEYEKFWRVPYRAPLLSNTVTMILVVLFACFSMVRGVGLAFDTNTNTTTAQVVNTLHAQLWGWALMGASLYLIITLVFGFKFFVWTAHVISFAVYFGLFVDFCHVVILANGDGYWKLLVPLTGVIWHSLFVRLVRPFGTTKRRRV